MTLYGLRARDVPEEIAERAMREELRHFVESVPDAAVDLAVLRDTCPVLFSARLYEQTRALKLWLVPILYKRIERCILHWNVFVRALMSLSSGQVNLDVLLTSYVLLEHLGCLESVFDVRFVGTSTERILTHLQ